MSDSATFEVRLIDKIKGPARSAEKALGRLTDRVQSVSRDVRSTGGSWSRFRTYLMGAEGGIKGVRAEGGRFIKGSAGLFDKVFGRGGSARQAVGGFWKDVVAGNLVTQAINKIGELGAAAVRGTADFVMFGERSRLALGQLGKHGSGEKLFTLAREMAKKFGMDVQDTTANLQHLLAAQFKPKLASDIIKMGADLRAIGASSDATGRAIDAITKIKGTGILQGDELNMLAEAGVSIDLIRQKMGKLLGGKSNLEVLKLQTAGKIDADTAITAILQAVQEKTGSKQLGEAGARFAETTIEGMIGRGKALAQDAAIKVTDRIRDNLNKLAAKGLGKLSSFLESPKGEAFMERLGNAIDKVIGIAEAFGTKASQSFSSVMKVIGPVFGIFETDGNTAQMVVESLGKALGFAAAIALVVGGAMLAAGAAVVFITGAIIEGAIGAFDWLVEKVGSVILWFDDLGAKIRHYGGVFLDSALGLGKAIIDGLTEGIIKFATAPIDAIANVGKKALGAFKSVLGIASPSKVMFSFGQDTTAGFAAAVDSGASAVAASGGGLAEAHIGGFAEASGGGLADLNVGGFDLQSQGLDFEQSWSGFDFQTSSAVDPAMTSFTSTSPVVDSASIGGGGGSFDIDLDVNVEGGDSPEETGRAAARETRRELEDFFRQLDMEG